MDGSFCSQVAAQGNGMEAQFPHAIDAASVGSYPQNTLYFDIMEKTESVSTRYKHGLYW